MLDAWGITAKGLKGMNEHNETRAIEVRTTRKAQGLTQERLAKLALVSIRTIRNVEAGKDVDPSTVALVYNALGMKTPEPSWPEPVRTFLDMVGYALTAKDPTTRKRIISEITLLVIEQ